MKRLLFIALALFLESQAQASVSPPEFMDRFVSAMNRRLVVTNQDRIMSKQTIYCTGLSHTQIETISNIIRENTEQTVQEFAAKASQSLRCYPSLVPQLKNSGWDILTKSYWKDIELVRATLADLGIHTKDGLTTKILDSISP